MKRSRAKKWVLNAGISLAALLPMKSTAQYLNGPTPLEVIGNTFSQPNVHLQVGRNALDWYGSGDVNNDGKIDGLDIQEIDSGYSNDRSDVDGDGVPSTENDKQLLQDFINGSLAYLPGHWNKLETREEKESWIEKMLRIDETSEISSLDERTYGWDCANFVNQLTINFYGLSNIEEFSNSSKTEYFTENNARFNLPVYYFSTFSQGVPHAVGGVLVGEDVQSLKDFYFIDVYSDSRIYPGHPQMDENSSVTIGALAYRGEDKGWYVDNIIKFSLKDGVGNVVSYMPYVVLEDPNKIKVNVGGLENLVIKEGDISKGATLSPEFLSVYGYNSFPNVDVEGTEKEPKVTYVDKDTIEIDEGYSFNRYFIGTVEALKQDTWTPPRYNGIYVADTSDVPQNIRFVYAPVETTAVKPLEEMARSFEVSQNYPNPFNSSTSVKYSVGKNSDVSFRVYDVNGKLVDECSYENVSSGDHEYDVNLSGSPSGNYFLKIQNGNEIKTVKMNYTK